MSQLLLAASVEENINHRAGDIHARGLGLLRSSILVRIGALVHAQAVAESQPLLVGYLAVVGDRGKSRVDCQRELVALASSCEAAWAARSALASAAQNRDFELPTST